MASYKIHKTCYAGVLEFRVLRKGVIVSRHRFASEARRWIDAQAQKRHDTSGDSQSAA